MKEYQWYLTVIPKDNTSPVANPSGLTLYRVESDHISSRTHGSVEDTDLSLLKQHFGVYKEADFIRKEFVSRHSDPSAAMDLFLVTLRCGGNYSPPPYDDVLYRVALALSNFSTPNYLDVDKETLRVAFAMVWNDPDWIEQLKDEIKKLSRGYVTLTIDSSRWMPTRGHGSGKYFHLILGDQAKIVCIGPYGVSMK